MSREYNAFIPFLLVPFSLNGLILLLISSLNITLLLPMEEEKIKYYLICIRSRAEVNCSTITEKIEVMEELKHFAARLMDGCDNGSTTLPSKAYNSSHYMEGCCTVKAAGGLVKEEKLRAR